MRFPQRKVNRTPATFGYIDDEAHMAPTIFFAVQHLLKGIP